jgi:hypothetical protein
MYAYKTDNTTRAREALDCFETAGRPDGGSFVRLREGRPEWVADLVHEAHGSMLPDDWRYACIRAALEAVAEGVDGHEFADGYADDYSSDLAAWLGSHAVRPGYVDEAVEDLGAEFQGVAQVIQLGQRAEAREVFAAVVNTLEQEV